MPTAAPRWLQVLLIGAFSCAGAPSTGPATPAHTVAPEEVAAAPETAAPISEDAPLPIDRKVRVGTLSNGMRYYIRAHRRPEQRAALRLAVNVGSVLENDDQRGYAHFVEHMAFNGTRLFKKQEMIDYFEKVGMRFGDHANASTSFDETIYTLEIPTDDDAVVEKAFLILQQMAGEVAFDPAEVNRERGVVIEEWRLGLGAMMRIMNQLLPVVFKGSRYAERVPIGT